MKFAELNFAVEAIFVDANENRLVSLNFGIVWIQLIMKVFFSAWKYRVKKQHSWTCMIPIATETIFTVSAFDNIGLNVFPKHSKQLHWLRIFHYFNLIHVNSIYYRLSHFYSGMNSILKLQTRRYCCFSINRVFVFSSYWNANMCKPHVWAHQCWNIEKYSKSKFNYKFFVRFAHLFKCDLSDIRTEYTENFKQQNRFTKWQNK